MGNYSRYEAVDFMPQSGGIEIISSFTLPGTSYDMYAYDAPQALPGLAFTGGWLSEGDIGPDVIYVSEVGNLSFAVPLTWTNPSFASQYHNNDPSVIGGPAGGAVFMYFTSLDNKYTSLEDITTHNMISLAISEDQGKTWTDKGEILPGWAPSALQMGKYIEVFYHNAEGVTEMSILCENGTSILSSPFVLQDVQHGHTMHLLNVSVIQLGQELIMVGNGGQDGTRFGDILGYEASVSDPLHWKPLLENGSVFLPGNANMLLTPEISSLGHGEFSLTYTEDLAHDVNGIFLPGISQETITKQVIFHL